ncbi:MAG: HAD family phosphatase [Anaerolineales bacterium]|nr:HAD family phosphatase [Anaerolineales bacterium]
MKSYDKQSLAIVFDFGGVLIDWNPRYLYRKFFDGDERAMEAFLEAIGFHEWNMKQDAGRPFAEAIAEHCQKYPEYCELIRAYEALWEESIAGPIQASVDILNEFKQAGYPLYALSNWSAETFPRARHRFHFLDWFEAIILSGEVGLVKPDPRIFRLLLERLNRRAKQCLIIDDSVGNILAARQLGFRTIHFQSPEQLRREVDRMGILKDAS